MHIKIQPDWKKEVKCARVLCDARFVPSRRWQIYHNATCRAYDRIEKQGLQVEAALKICEALIVIARGENRSSKMYRGLCEIRRALVEYLKHIPTTVERAQSQSRD